MKALALMLMVAVRLGAQSSAEPTMWAAGPQIRIASSPLPATAIGAYLSRNVVAVGPLVLAAEIDGFLKTKDNTRFACIASPCPYWPPISSTGDLMLRVSTRASPTGWRPSLAVSGGYYLAQADRSGPFDTHTPKRVHGVLLGVGIGILPRGNRGFTMEAAVYNYAALEVGDVMAIGLRGGWKW